ncbi:thiamine pyrophosphate-binding protein [Acetobacter senegalensis]|uniref:alpha-keto acid decarboxylase family protein n=1 Tax=Acetobacter senegalensis TaxID=446692 RepID=UPI00209ED1EC|nr:thiamine pyrophosphate-binding protein [Acetobacter senegalensis]MCP1197500.1 thiamine pyrophosphate-binding protein [Acetobacter senegalensis]
MTQDAVSSRNIERIHGTVGEILLDALIQNGVRYIFGVPGDFNLTFLDIVERHPQVNFISCRNELNASYAADGYSRIVGLGVLVTTYGVGDLSALNGVAGAYAEKIPLIHISGSPPTHAVERGLPLHHTAADGNFDNVLNCFREFTVESLRLSLSDTASEISRVIRIALTESRPVYIQLPSDIVDREISGNVVSRPSVVFADAVTKKIAWRIFDQIDRSVNPILLVGGAYPRSHFMELLLELAGRRKIPVILSPTAKGILSEYDNRFHGYYKGKQSGRNVSDLMDRADCIVAIGMRYSDVETGLFSDNIDPAVLIDIQPEIVTLGQDAVAIPSANSLIEEILNVADISSGVRGDTSRYALAQKRHHKPGEQLDSLTHASLWACIEDFLDENDIVVTDTGTAFSGLMSVKIPQRSTVISQPTWASLGYALPAALGASVAAQGRRVVAFLGDGSLQMTIQEFSTIASLELPILFFFINNNGYTIEKLINGLHAEYNKIPEWHYLQIIKAMSPGYDIFYRKVNTVNDFYSATECMASHNAVAFIDMVLASDDFPDGLDKFCTEFARFDYGILRD